MSTTMTTTTLGSSNLRGSSSKTRNLPARTSRNARSSLRQNSLLSIPTSAQGAPQPDSEPHGFYPAITHFTDAITALPRDFRRHTSLLKEVDAKAWALEENLQKLLQQCLYERQSRAVNSTAQTVAGSVSSVAGDIPAASAGGSVVGNAIDTSSQYSTSFADSDLMRRRRLYHELRNNLMQMIMPLDEKNHVISNANEELSRHTRRQDEIWPRIADEISEETRLGSLRHWALTDLNPTKKTQAAAARGREAAAALLPDNEVAERSERRREAMALAKKQKTTLQVDSDAEARKGTRKGPNAKKGQEIDDALAAVPVTVVGNIPSIKLSKARTAANKKQNESVAKTGNSSSAGGIAMSRETSQQDNSKKRKAPTLATTTARKRMNAATHDSPKLGHSPLAGTFGKDVKKSPALSHVRPVHGRGRQTSAQAGEPSNRPSSAASRRNGVNATGSELERVGVAINKTVNEVKHTMRETTNSRGEKMFEEDVPDTVDNRMKGGILLERSASKSSLLKREANLTDGASGRRTASPRLSALDTGRGEKNGKAKAKTSTPVLGSWTEPETSESTQEATPVAENGGGDGHMNDSAFKPKRQARPRIKDHHGLHDSLSPKGLPTKRTHKKNGSYSLAAALSTRKDREDESPAMERKPTTSRTNSRSAKNNSVTDVARDGRHASSTPRITGPLTEFVDEPDSLPSAVGEDPKYTSSRRQSQNPKHSSSYHHLDVKPPGTTSTSSRIQASPKLKSETPLGSPGPEEHDILADGDAGVDDDEEDPNEQRYCYCNGVSYGEMVACDNENCAREWFHLECTGLRSLQAARSTWYCDECKASMAR